MLDVLEPSLYLSALGMLFDSPVMERFLDASFPTISSSMWSSKLNEVDSRP